MTLIQSEPKKILMRTASRLPAEYQEVEYIESSGTQYIAPGVSHSAGDTIKVEADIYIKGNGAIYSQYTSYSPYNTWQLGIDNGNFFARMNAESGGLSTIWTPSTYTVNTRYSVVAEGQTSINQKAPYLLANNDANGVHWYMSAKLYSFKIYRNGTLVRDLVPCYRKADTIIGLYDLVNDTFYTNSGTGTFTKGANILGGEQEIKKIVIFPDGVTEKQIRPAIPLSPIEAGIYHSATLGLITIADGNGNDITIADKNLGASTVYNDGDTLSEANCGKNYQRGNNYGFPFTGAVTTSSTKVDASNYGPGNYYNTGLFITTSSSPYDRSSVQNDNLWGNTTDTNIARRGPCDEGYHIPVSTEWQTVNSIGISLGAWSSSDYNSISNYLKLPLAGARGYSDGGVSAQGEMGYYWCSDAGDGEAYHFLFNSYGIFDNKTTYKSVSHSIRPFKNEVVAPDNTWTKIYEKVTPLCFTANTAGSTVRLTKTGSPAAVSLEKSTDGTTWTDYTIGDTITLANVGDKVYWRNKSETTTGFSTSGANYYNFVMTGSIAGSGDVNYLLNKNSTDTVSVQCYRMLFSGCTSLTTAPSLPATTLANRCYNDMFKNCTSLTTAPALPATTLANYCYSGIFHRCTSLTTAPALPATTLADNCYSGMFTGCTSLTTVPELPATTLADYCYYMMFHECTQIKLSTTQTGEYQIPYRIPTTGTGTTATGRNNNMFYNTGGTFTGNPSINTTYYTSNQVI